ncbi:hypothetical protein MHI18_01690 [Peribacillus sp. FSL H8-0477]|uniref:hypothetical protein n=1 Tax=Peribacillus sp. FSL H8-0477 TaxID=2921388 RepID=UPI0030F56DEC
MQDYILSGAGIVVSIIIYVLTYKQTIGAKKERTINANEEIVKILIRRMVNEDFEITLRDIYWLMEGKSRDFKIKVADLYSQEQILNSVFTKILETDFLSVTQRKKVIEQITTLILNLKELEINEDEKIKAEKERGFSKYLLPISTALLGPLVALLINSSLNIGLNLDRTIISLTFLVSTLITLIISFILRFKESSKDILPINHMTRVIDEGIAFEKEVVRQLNRKFNIIPSENRFYDYKITDKDILIDVKVWRETVHTMAVNRAVDRLQKAIDDKEGTKGIIIVKNENEIFSKFNTPMSNIKILNLEDAFKELNK